MTKIKKTLALMMVLVMAMTTLILPVSATTVEDEVEPCSGTVLECPVCGKETYGYAGPFVEQGSDDIVCSNNPRTEHTHYYNYYYNRYLCTNCGFIKLLFINQTETCSYVSGN